MRKKLIATSAAMIMAFAANAHAAHVHRLWNGTYNFYTTSTTEAMYLVSIGWRIEAWNYFNTFDTAQPFSTVDILRCYSPYKNIHYYPTRNYAGGSCSAFGFVDEGTLGKIRTVFSSQSTPLPGYGRPVWAMTRVIGLSPDGTSITRQLITTSADEARALCRITWAPAFGANPQTCFWGYVAY